MRCAGGVGVDKVMPVHVAGGRFLASRRAKLLVFSLVPLLLLITPPFVSGLVWFKLYWAAWALLLAVLASLFLVPFLTVYVANNLLRNDIQSFQNAAVADESDGVRGAAAAGAVGGEEVVVLGTRQPAPAAAGSRRCRSGSRTPR